MSAAWPKRCTGMIAFVRGVIRRAASATSRLKQAGCESTNTGFAPTRSTPPAVAKNVNAGQSTSSPGPIPSAMSASKIASVPELTPSTYFAPVKSASAFSNFSTSGPRMNSPECSTRKNASCNSGSSALFCAFRSNRLTFMRPEAVRKVGMGHAERDFAFGRGVE